jgi:hypothetical protein
VNEKLAGVVIQAPDGEIVNFGVSYEVEESEKLKVRQQADNGEFDDEIIYRLYESILPFLYFTNKLDKNLHLEFAQYDEETGTNYNK